jgi:phosphoglycolate phosphatase-like HAD superfamily hydrolase
MQLVLFDIDGTLVNTGRAGADAMTRAFAEMYGIPEGFAGIRMSGKTDPMILQEALDTHRLPLAEGAFAAFHEHYIVHLRRTLQEPARQRRLLPGLPHLLEALAAQEAVLLGLLTGNVVLGHTAVMPATAMPWCPLLRRGRASCWDMLLLPSGLW